MEDYSPGDSLPDSSDELFQRGTGRCQYMYDFRQGVCAVSATSQQKVITVLKEQDSQLVISVPF